MVSVEPLKYLLLATDQNVHSLIGESHDTEKSGVFPHLNLLAQYGSLGKLAFRKNKSPLSPFLQILGLQHTANPTEESEHFDERYGKLAIHVITNSTNFADSAKPLLNLGRKKHCITKLTSTSTVSLLEELESALITTMHLDDSSHAADFQCTYVFLSTLTADGSTSSSDYLSLYDSLTKHFIEKKILQLPPPNFKHPVDDSSLVNELYIKQSALPATPPPLPPYSLWVSLAYGPLIIPNDPDVDHPLLPQSYTRAFEVDISKELSDERLCYLHCCPGHTRIDNCSSLFALCKQPPQKGAWLTILSEQILSEIAYRVHCTPKFGA